MCWKIDSEICRPFLLCANKQIELCKTAVGFIQFPTCLDVRSTLSMALWYILVLSIWWVCKKFDIIMIKSLVNHCQSKNMKSNKLCSNMQKSVLYFCHIHGTEIKTSRRTRNRPTKIVQLLTAPQRDTNFENKNVLHFFSSFHACTFTAPLLQKRAE